MSTNSPTTWVGAMHADSPLKRTRRKLICLSRRKDSGILHEYVLQVNILRHIRWGFVYIDSRFGDPIIENIEDVVDAVDVVDVVVDVVDVGRYEQASIVNPHYIYDIQTFKMG